jgi:nucleoside 2-deoxyribosyltransferase
MKKIYLAGFDVFRQDAAAHGKHLKACCAQAGFTGLYPLDDAIPAGLSGAAAAQWIYEANIDLIRQADLLIANLNNFRGAEPDSGTCFEIGFATALNKPVWGYMDHADSLLEQIAHTLAADGSHLDAEGYVVENFGLPRNLMLSCSGKIIRGSFQDCLALIDP